MTKSTRLPEPSMGAGIPENPHFERLLEYLTQTRGSDFTAYQRSSLARCIDTRMGSLNVRSYADYLDYLEGHPDESSHLFNVARQHKQQCDTHRVRELEAASKALQATIEELQSRIEELEATNEELKSTNEELETMNEELQSANEELETVNEELRRRGIELARSNLFLNSILRSMPLAAVVLSEDLVVESWNDVAADMWGLRQSEVQGQPFLSLDLGMPLERLRQPLLTLLQTPGRPSELTLAATNRRGESMTLRVYCVSAGSGVERGRGVILLMQEAPADVRRATP